MPHGKVIFALLAAVAIIFTTTMLAAAVTKKDCQDCHADKSLEGTSLYIDPAKYQLTNHAHLGCIACHDKISRRHPDDGVRSGRVSCATCHAEVAREYAQSGHSNYAECIACHNPHTARNVHGVSVQDINQQCAKCHETAKVIKSHAKWLPQTRLHIEALPCITCHTGSKEYVIALYPYTYTTKKEPSPGKRITLASYNDLQTLFSLKNGLGTLIDADQDGTVSLEEMGRFLEEAKKHEVALLGTMMPEVATHNYQVLKNRYDCTFCHASGPNVQQVSNIVFPEKDGSYKHLPVEKGAITHLLYGTPDFYMVGFMRSQTLNIIGALIVAVGLMVPLLHGALRFLTRKRRKAG